MTPSSVTNIILGLFFCGLLSILNGGGIVVAIVFFIIIVVYNVQKSDDDKRRADFERNTKIVWSEKQQAFIRIPKDQKRWE